MDDDLMDESRTITAGSVTVTITAEPLLHDFDEAELGRAPARAIRDAIADGIRAINAVVSPATVKFREKGVRSWNRGAKWARDRWPEPPASDRLFNASGSLADGIEAVQSGEGWQIVAPDGHDNLNDEGRDGRSLLERLADTVPAIEDPLREAGVNDAIDASWEKIFPNR